MACQCPHKSNYKGSDEPYRSTNAEGPIPVAKKHDNTILQCKALKEPTLISKTLDNTTGNKWTQKRILEVGTGTHMKVNTGSGH